MQEFRSVPARIADAEEKVVRISLATLAYAVGLFER